MVRCPRHWHCPHSSDTSKVHSQEQILPHVGYFQEANGGTLFLDEVANLPMEMQRMLLRAIQERRYRPIGAKGDKTADVRIVAATNEDLQKAVAEKRFREDLLYRLKEYTITVPPLRNCQEDIMPLAEFFLEFANKELERNIRALTHPHGKPCSLIRGRATCAN